MKPGLLTTLLLSAACARAAAPTAPPGPNSAAPVDKPPAAAAAPQADQPGVPPGAVPYPAALVSELAAKLGAKDPSYEPRTHHKHADGRPKFTNRLIRQSSPYLLQHAHNPVDWFSWGPEAFDRASQLNRPVLLSVGYSTCHWCHVMEEESFEDVEIATYMNRQFVSIKVDREERPDVDDVYMDAVNLLTGRGGWPMTVVMTPDRRPFFGGTYFPPRTGVRGARRGFIDILQELAGDWQKDSGKLLSQASDLSRRLNAMARPAPGVGVPTAEALSRAAGRYDRMFDETHAGFGRSRKFPRPVSIEFLLRYHRRSGDARAKQMALRTLDAMIDGGIHDQVGGGFHRYTVDAQWLVPHFEKMLYDNAQLAGVFIDAWQATGLPRYAAAAARTLDYLDREMTDPSGGFWSATDADSEGEEGKFFVWTPPQIEAVVGAADARAFNAFYGVTARGNFEHRTSIPHITRPPKAVAKELGMPVALLQASLQRARTKLYLARKDRIPPLTDTKLLTSWNALAISAFARAGLALDRPDYVARAVRAAEVFDTRMWVGRGAERRLHRVLSEDAVRQKAFLDDHAFLANAFLDLFEATAAPRWLQSALRCQQALARLFAAPGGGFFFSGNDNERLLVRQKPSYDGAVPSGNSDAALALLRLGVFTGDAKYTQAAEEALGAFSDEVTRRPTSAPRLLTALDFRLDEPKEVVLISPPGAYAGQEHKPMYDALRRAFLPARALVRLEDSPAALAGLKEQVPFAQDKVTRGGKTTAYVCKQQVCKRPTSDPKVFAKQLAEVTPYPR